MKNTLYPPIDSFASGMMPVDDTHTIYWEESGNPDGVPILHLHGGPGGVMGPVARQYYDPDFYRFVYPHQRGAGQSTPLGETRANTTQHLIADLEQLRKERGIDKWVVAGGSWGSTLTLAYGQAHPESCLGLLASGIFLGRQRDIDWFFHGARDFFPLAWEAFLDFLPEDEREDYFAAYARRILSDDPDVHGPAVKAWSAYEGSIASLKPDAEVLNAFQDPAFALAYARMNIHYFGNECFLKGAPILENIDRIRHLPGVIVHGRYDLATAYRSAVELSRAWPEAKFLTVEGAGHSRFDPPIREALLTAQEMLKTMVTPDAR